jgi:hypothetical protein
MPARQTITPAFTPHFTLDLATASTRAFGELLDTFEAWRAEQPERPVDLTNGWKTITPEIAESMLLRNPIGANRRPSLSTVKYYARQMAGGAWKRTGQPIIFTANGVGLDLGHRIWACYLSGATFDTYLVGDVPPEEGLFAYIDNSRPRSAADALATAGFDGLSKLLAQTVSLAVRYERGLLTPTTKRPLDKMAPVEVIAYVTDNPNLRHGARLMAGEYKSAAAVIEHADVAAFAAFQILDLHGEETLDQYMTALGEADGVDNSPVAAFQGVMAANQRAVEPMLKHQVLGYLIKSFNAWALGETPRRLTLKVNEPFPAFVELEPAAQAAE